MQIRKAVITVNVRRTFAVAIARFLSIHVNRIHVERGFAKAKEQLIPAFVKLVTQDKFVTVKLITAKKAHVRMELATGYLMDIFAIVSLVMKGTGVRL